MEKPVRKSPRMPNYDYSKDNYYFVTICTDNKNCIFGSVKELSRYGKIAADSVKKIWQKDLDVRIDKFVVMPNHVHMIVVIGCTENLRKNPSLNQVVGLYKSGVTREIHEIDPECKVWQRSFHDHVIRDQMDYERIWGYIDTNPMRWDKDCFYVE